MKRSNNNSETENNVFYYPYKMNVRDYRYINAMYKKPISECKKYGIFIKNATEQEKYLLSGSQKYYNDGSKMQENGKNNKKNNT